MNSITWKWMIVLAGMFALASAPDSRAQDQQHSSSNQDEKSFAACANPSSADAAIEACTRLLEHDLVRLRAFALISRGQAWKSKQELDRAISDFAAAISADPSSIYAYAGRADAYRQQGRCDQATADYDQVIRLQPDWALTYISRGLCRMNKKQNDGALADFDQAIKLDPDNVNGIGALAWSTKGALQSAKGDLDSAAADFAEAIRLDPQRAFFYIARGSVWSRKRDYDRALADFEQAIKLDSTNANGAAAQAWSLQGDVQSLRGDLDRAVAAYDEAIRLDPQRAAFYMNCGTAWRTKTEYGRAIQDYDRAIALQPDELTAYVNRGVALFSEGEFAKAADDFLRVVQRTGNAYAVLWLYLSRTRAGSKDAKNRLELAAGQLKHDWPYPVIELLLGRRALRAVRPATGRPEQECDVQFFSGEWQLLQGSREEAVTALQSVADKCPTNAAARGAAIADVKRLKP